MKRIVTPKLQYTIPMETKEQAGLKDPRKTGAQEREPQHQPIPGTDAELGGLPF
jgi:hypothetical protein